MNTGNIYESLIKNLLSCIVIWALINKIFLKLVLLYTHIFIYTDKNINEDVFNFFSMFVIKIGHFCLSI